MGGKPVRPEVSKGKPFALILRQAQDKPIAAIHALGDTPERWRTLRIGDATMSRTNYLYALPPQKLSSAAVVVRDELKRVVRRLVEEGEWQGVGLIGGAAAGDVVPARGEVVAA